MHAWESIQKTLDYIEDNIGDEILIESLAKTASLSMFYYQRLFARLVKKPVREYIKLRRLARACKSLTSKRHYITDIGVEYGFGSRETFSRAFKETYGLSPSEYRDKPVGLNHFDKPDLLLNYVMVDEGIPLAHEGIILEYNRKTLHEPIHFLGVKDFWRFQSGKMLGERTEVSEPSIIWQRFFNVLSDIPCIPCGRWVGVSYHGGAPDGYSTYFVGAEVEPTVIDSADERFASWQLPAREYIVCEYEAENFNQLMDSLGKMMKFTRFWLRKHGLTADGFFPEIHYNNFTSVGYAYMEMWIPFKARK
ncbi:MAG: AraC family transcriptional regulator [Defluviitaleaceae bacterium]|nr:AraC family transcriptional regulator [Defluviitaleaceae bacterium]